MNSNIINISFNNKEEEKENIENNININNNLDNDSFTNIKITKEFESYPNNDLKENPEKNLAKTKINESIEVKYDDIPYQLNIYLKFDNTIHIELIPKDGYLPYSYSIILDEKKFYDLNQIFKEINSIEKIYSKIINLLRKNRVLLLKEKQKDIFYLILRITIIDEDKEIFIPLNKNENIQISTINYLLREAKLLKREFDDNEIKKELMDSNIEINAIKENNKYYINTINKSEKSLEEFSKIIIEQNEECKEMKNRINMIETEVNLLKNKVKCKFSHKNIIFYISINQKNQYYLFHFGIRNNGNLILNSKYDKIFLKIEGISQDLISFFSPSEKYINFTNANQNLAPNENINVCKKMTIKDLKQNSKYEFFININSICHGKITEEPLKIIILTGDYKDKNFITLLKSDQINFDISNQKVIFEYLEEINAIEENKNIIINKKRFKINSYLYNNKKGVLENQNDDLDSIEYCLIINKEYIENIKNKINEKYKNFETNDKINIEDIICSCAGDFQVICKVIEKLKNSRKV